MSIGDKDAFPTPEMRDPKGDIVVWPGPGMTYREHLIAVALQGTLANPAYVSYPERELSTAIIEQVDDLIAKMDEDAAEERSG